MSRIIFTMEEKILMQYEYVADSDENIDELKKLISQGNLNELSNSIYELGEVEKIDTLENTIKIVAVL